MRGGSTRTPRACAFLVAALLVLTLLAGWPGRQRQGPVATPIVPVDDWDVPQLVACLNRAGLGLRTVATQRNGSLGQRAFLTSTGKGWTELNGLRKIPDCLDRWQGSAYCERCQDPSGPCPDLTSLWGDCCLVVGRFVFFGDRELLARIRVALTRAPGKEPG